MIGYVQGARELGIERRTRHDTYRYRIGLKSAKKKTVTWSVVPTTDVYDANAELAE